MIFSVACNAFRKRANSPPSARATAGTDCEMRVSCPIANCSLSQRFLTVVCFRSRQATTCLRASFLRSLERSQALSPMASRAAASSSSAVRRSRSATAAPPQARQKLGAGDVVLDDRLAMVTAAHDVVDSTLEFDSWLAWHAESLA